MIFNLYNVMDKVAEEYAPPFVAKNDAVALRQFNQMIKNLNVNDYDLNFIGKYDTDTGLITVSLPEKLNASEVANG